MNEIEFVEKHLGEYRIKGNEINVKKCPFCFGGRHNDKYKFFINIDKHTFICQRGSCGVRGTFKQLAEQFNERAGYVIEMRKQYFENNIPKKTYKKPSMELNTLQNTSEGYIKARKIGDSTINHFKIKSDTKGNIVFPYYDENNNHVLNKIRIPRKFIKGKDNTKIWQEGEGKPVLFNMNNIDVNKPVVIIEGEWDCLSVFEAGYTNVVSVPFGTENLEWINECWEWLEKVKEFIIWFDNDEAGKKGAATVIRKLGAYKCKQVVNELTKDANELLFKHGPSEVIKVIEKSDYVPIEHLERLSEVKKVKAERMLFGLADLDYELGGCRFGELTIWTGKRGGGKSTVLSQTIPEAVEQKQKTFIYSGELSNSKVKEWLDRQIAGEKNIVTYEDELTRRKEYGVLPAIENKINDWYKEYVFTYGDNGENDENSLFEIMEYAYKRHNIRRFIIDNLKTIRFTDENNFYRAQGLFVNRCKTFCRAYDVHIDLVVHPRKSEKNGDLYDEDIGGSVDIIDLADNIISISRLTQAYYEKHKDKEEEYMRHKDHPYGEYDEYAKDTIIQILKNREYGDTGNKMYYFFDPVTKRIYKNFKRVEFDFLKGFNPANYFEDEAVQEECPF